MADRDDGFLGPFLAEAADAPERIYATFAGQSLSFGDVERMSARLAGWLRQAGVSRGARVALMLRNSPITLGLMFAIARCGAVWVPINVAARGDNLGYVLDHAAPALVIAEEDLVETVRTSGCRLDAARVVAVSSVDADAAESVGDVAGRCDMPAASDLFAVMYTSGTTGRPKGVLVTHRMMRLSGEGAALLSGAGAGDVMLVWEPLYHIGGAQLIVLPVIRGARLAFVERFSASRFWREAIEAGATHIHYLGGILQILLKQPPSEFDRAHDVRIAWGGGCPVEIWRTFEERFGVEIRECYGMTECSSFTTVNLERVAGSVGRAVPWLEVEVLRGDGSAVAVGERGEIVVRERLAGALTAGYLDNPEATARALRDGAFHTGDVGSLDEEGRLTFHGRMTDSARVKGENVAAVEVESVAAKHPDVVDCAMLAVKADVGEEDIKLVVQARPGAALTAEALSAWLGDRLAPYQRPRYIAFVDTFERTPSQRIMKHKLSVRTDDCWERPG